MDISMPCSQCYQSPICKMSKKIQNAMKANEYINGHIDVVCGKFKNDARVHTCSCSSIPSYENDTYYRLDRDKKCADICKFVGCCTLEEDVDSLLGICEQLSDDNIIAQVSCRFCQLSEDKV